MIYIYIYIYIYITNPLQTLRMVTSLPDASTPLPGSSGSSWWIGLEANKCLSAFVGGYICTG